MADWYQYQGDRFEIELPAGVKPLKSRRYSSGALFRGRAIKARRDSAILVAVDPALHADFAADYLKSMRDPDPDDTMFRYHHYGTSRTRPGGVEVWMSAFPPDKPSGVHRWMIAFPQSERWLYVDLQSVTSGMSWDEFYAVGERIVNSFHVQDGLAR